MRTLKTPKELRKEVYRDRDPSFDMEDQCIIVAQRDALECAYEMLCIDGDIDSILNLLPKDK